MPSVRLGPIIGLIFSAAFLGALWLTIGLRAAGWIIGGCYAVAIAILVTRAMHRTETARFGPADWVTITRAALVGGVTALTADSLTGAVPATVFVSITTAALVLDAVDGLVARRTLTASSFGARFDMEVDAFLIAVLSVYVAPMVGGWVLTIGAMRYAYVAASWVLPWMHRTPPPRYWCKVVAAIQGIVLVVVAAEVVWPWLSIAALLIALALLVESFGRDFLWLWRRRGEPLPQAGVDVAGAAQRPEALEQPLQRERV
ncbi:membrane protein [Rhizocola hellebori]|uniref:Membrane protein n=1 Tax=Rhizocola hellebori TaxID=1392758 RepID=A0A8J3VIV9_9ACTN|nr:CDP-alcohol phosphatidyltransferase family protein [Rhizocola hellebori]GIH07990.1 membrane protein [Rhizocola hellebori]